MTNIQNATVQAGSCTVHFLQAGDRQQPAVLLLHGKSFQAATWRELGTLAALDAAGFFSLALDLPGFGQSPACPSAPREVLLDFITGRELKKPVLIGPSMSGRICLEFALNHPEAVGGLVLVGAVGVEENRERLSEISVPCLVVWGSKDKIAPPAHGRLLLEKITGASLLVFEGAGHPCYLEQPHRWHRELTGFLRENFS